MVIGRERRGLRREIEIAQNQEKNDAHAMDGVQTNPLHLLDDYLTALTQSKHPFHSAEAVAATDDVHGSESSKHGIHHDLTLRVAADLFGNNITLLENALALLEEQEQRQKEMQTNSSDDGQQTNIIRHVRAKRSGRNAVLIRKQRKGKRNSSGGDNDANMKDNDNYLIMPGKERTDASHQVHRRGMHCTCRSFLNNIKGGGRKSGGANDLVMHGSQNIICKHLLAVILMPHVMPWNKDGVSVEALGDREFAKVIASCQI